MLSDRERWIVHFCCMMTIARMTGLPNRTDVIAHIMGEVRRERTRSLSDEDEDKLLADINEEMSGGRNMFKYLTDEVTRRNDPSEEWR